MFDKREIETFFGDRDEDEQTCSLFIETVVMKLFRQEMNFEPLQINISNFSLRVEDDQGNSFCLDDEQAQELWNNQIVLLARVARKGKKARFQALKEQGKDSELLEILSADQRDLVEKIDRHKTIKDLKEKLSSYYYHLVDRIILVTYTQLKVMDNKKKIADLPEKIL